MHSCTIRHPVTSLEHQAHTGTVACYGRTLRIDRLPFLDTAPGSISVRAAIPFSTNHASEREPGPLQLLPA